ncbi:amino acid adenylation domain-containing protein, partial [Ascidiimonas sp. W6]|uniref:non-ribosomal peptide synthetase n=1 Tax=Ascidiimonas meishanensis TaxID=3128903 RepID=UPI0030EEC046
QHTLSAFDHQLYQYEDLVEALRLQRDTSRNPLFDVLFSYFKDTGEASDATETLAIDSYGNSGDGVSKFDLSLTITEDSNDVYFSISYATSLFTEATIQRLIGYLRCILESVIANPSVKLSEITILSESEQQKLLQGYNATEVAYATDQTLVSLFSSQASSTPDLIALICEDRSIDYATLDTVSNQLSHHLLAQSSGVTHPRIGVKLVRDEWLLISLLAILKAGGTYVPIDITYPSARITEIERDSDCLFLIDSAFLNEFESLQHTYATSSVDMMISSDDLAYLIYTSGSTGKPKGVQLTHGNVASLLQWSAEEFKDTAFQIMYAATSHCFDLSVYEMFYPLSIGKTLRILPNGLKIADYLTQDRGILINTVPSVVQSLVDEHACFDGVTAINMAGEVIPIGLIDHFKGSSIELRNLYGPSEDTTYSSCYRIATTVPYKGSIPIGKPIANTRFYLLSSAMTLVPSGVIGELYIEGSGVASGYFNRPLLTQERFISSPFTEGATLYKTGDLARWLPDGNLEFIGRNDHQVKLRGYRIELQEISHQLTTFSEVDQALVIATPLHNNTPELVAYIIGASSISPDILRSYLSSKLPAY